MTARCRECGLEWDRDPALEVECPTCGAGVGSPCRRPSGHRCSPHRPRDELAMKELCEYTVCRADDWSPTEPEAPDEVDQSSLAIFGSGGQTKIPDVEVEGDDRR